MGFCKNKELEETGGFPPRPFHETKRERKFYEDKKQKALRYIDHTLDEISSREFYLGKNRPEIIQWVNNRLTQKITVIRKMVNDI